MQVGATKMNQKSSRSHSILTLTLVRVEGTDTTGAADLAAAFDPSSPWRKDGANHKTPGVGGRVR